MNATQMASAFDKNNCVKPSKDYDSNFFEAQMQMHSIDTASQGRPRFLETINAMQTPFSPEH
jgi:hypothetical protein